MDDPGVRLPRDGFSVAGLVAFMVRTLEDIDPALLPDPPIVPSELRDGRDAIVREKRRIADHAFAVGGAAPLLAVGQRLRDVAFNPGIAVLLDPPAPAVLRERWMHRERYQRYPQRVEIVPAGELAWNCTLRASGASPSVAEAVLVSGILAGLLALIGARGVGASFGDDGPDHDALLAGAPLASHQARRFTLRWMAVDAAMAIDVRSTTGRSSVRAGADASTTARVQTLLGGDVVRRWSLGDVARELCTSTRSLQRALAAEGRAFSTILREVRVGEAARQLRDTDRTLELVGFAAGFADQSHFQREFARTLLVTPADYRRVARAGSPDPDLASAVSPRR